MGATVTPHGVEFRVWAPDVQRLDLEVEGMPLQPFAHDAAGVWSCFAPGIGAGTRYRFRTDDRWGYPDPYSRSQPEGPHGPSEVIDPGAHTWHDGRWRGLSPEGLVIYELHVGTYTPDGTFDALTAELDALRDLGITAIELMPIAEFPGARNWGYDGVNLFAPSHVYGGPGAFKRLVDAAHERGIGIILDVVYNHFGPDGNYLLQFARDYMTSRHTTPWGDAVNFDGVNSDMVRRFVIDNTCFWIDEYHVDGLRLDATFAIFDESPRQILEELTAAARACVAPHRGIVLIAETYENDARYLRPPSEGGFGFDAVWSDDFHHVAHRMLTREHGGYFADYAGTADELTRTINRGWLFEGQRSGHFGTTRGTPSNAMPARSFIYSVQNHDQTGNRPFGRRLSQIAGIDAELQASALMLLLPFTPMLFMGQEFAASTRFCYFTDHHGELGRAVTEGRLAEFASSAAGSRPREIPDPQAERTFLDSKLRLDERTQGRGPQHLALYRTLLALRRDDPVLRRQDRRHMEAIAASETLLLVHLWHEREHRLAVANFGVAVDATPGAAGVPHDLARLDWEVRLSTAERRFGGADATVRFDGRMLSLPPHSVSWLAASE
jgi:maltooligosyltrehalose trehalohydrolase